MYLQWRCSSGPVAKGHSRSELARWVHFDICIIHAETAESETAERETAESEAAESETAESETAESETAESEAAESETAFAELLPVILAHRPRQPLQTDVSSIPVREAPAVTKSIRFEFHTCSGSTCRDQIHVSCSAKLEAMQ